MNQLGLKMKSIKAYYTEPSNFATVEVNVRSVEDLRSLISKVVDEISANSDSPVGIDLEREDGSAMSIAPGKTGWAIVATFGDEQRCSIGNKEAGGVEAFYFDQWTEIPKSWLIPEEKALPAIEEWFETGKLSDRIEWGADCA